MNQEMVKVTIDGKEHEYAIGTTLQRNLWMSIRKKWQKRLSFW